MSKEAINNQKKKQKKNGWNSLILSGACFAIAIFIFYCIFYQFLFDKPDGLLFFAGVGFVLASLMFYFLNIKETEMAIGFLVFVIVIFSGVTGVFIKDCQDEQDWERRWKVELYMYIESSKWSMIWEERAENAYQNYTNDSEMMNAFYSIASIHPFLKNQMGHLREYMDILVDNITIENYNCAHKQFMLCYIMDNDYSKNYTYYFNRFNELYEDLDYFSHVSVPFVEETEFEKEGEDMFLFAIRDDLDSSHNDGFEVLWFSDEITYCESQLEYIGGILHKD